MPDSRSHLLTLPCRYGLITFPREDSIVGKSLQTYGEWAQSEIDLLIELVPEGGRVVDAGAFVGTHTLALAARVGRGGQVIAVEGQPAIRALLRENVEQNHLSQVELVEGAVGRRRGLLRFPCLDLTAEANLADSRAVEEAAEPGESGPDDGSFLDVPTWPLDDLVSAVDVIKADVEGMEVPVLEGAERILAACRPHLYLECASVSNGLRILDFLLAHDYCVYMHRASAYNPENFFGSPSQIFGLARETNLLGVAGERIGEVEAVLRRHPDLVAVRTIDELASLHLTTARWGEPEWSSLTKPGLIARITRLLEDQDRLERLARATRLDQEATARAVESARTEIEALQRQLESESRTLRAELETERAQRSAEAEEAHRALEAKEAEHAARAEEWRREVASLEHRRVAEAAAAQREIEALRQRRIELVEEEAERDENLARAQRMAASAAVPPTALAIIRRLFDADHYLASAQSFPAPDGDPLDDFLTSGGSDGRDPHRLFDSSFYLEANPDVRASGLDPLLHYVLQGAREGREPHPLFATSHYLAQAPESGQGGENPLLHFLTEGYRSGLDPHPLFLTQYYLDQAPECLKMELDPLSHYMTIGAVQGLDPHPLFDSSFYLSRQPGCRASGLDPLRHFLLEGAASGADPHPFFSCTDYQLSTPELEGSGTNPLLHFVALGRRLGRLPRAVFDLGRHKHSVTELDELRHDGRRVVLFLAANAHGFETRFQDLAELVRDRCVVLLLRPADHLLLGDSVRGLLALSPLGAEGPGLLFDPREQLTKLAAVLRGVGVVRAHVHWTRDDDMDMRSLVCALDVPLDLSLHDPRSAGRSRTGSGHPKNGEQEGPEWRLRRAARRLFQRLTRKRELAWLIARADRVIVPSAAARRRLARSRPVIRCIEAAEGDFYPDRYLDAEGLS